MGSWDLPYIKFMFFGLYNFNMSAIVCLFAKEQYLLNSEVTKKVLQ
jgi:hypothetical protein